MNTKELRIDNEDSWEDDGYWVCPHCQTRNEVDTWMDQETCSDCLATQVFETDYIDPYEGVIEKRYIGP